MSGSSSVFSTLKIDPLNESRCCGITQRGLPCNNPVAMASRHFAASILSECVGLPSTSSELRSTFKQAAGLLLCKRNHQYQWPDVRNSWLDRWEKRQNNNASTHQSHTGSSATGNRLRQHQTVSPRSSRPPRQTTSRPSDDYSQPAAEQSSYERLVLAVIRSNIPSDAMVSILQAAAPPRDYASSVEPDTTTTTTTLTSTQSVQLSHVHQRSPTPETSSPRHGRSTLLALPAPMTLSLSRTTSTTTSSPASTSSLLSSTSTRPSQQLVLSSQALATSSRSPAPLSHSSVSPSQPSAPPSLLSITTSQPSASPSPSSEPPSPSPSSPSASSVSSWQSETPSTRPTTPLLAPRTPSPLPESTLRSISTQPGGPRTPIRESHTECAICMEPYDEADRLSPWECCECRNRTHGGCFKTWADDHPSYVTCVYCRAIVTA